jgi:RNA12 protein
MVLRAITQLRKIGLGEDTEKNSSNSLQWTETQFWKIVQLLSKYPEVSFDHVCVDPLFRNDTNPLRQMERAGLVVLHHQNGRPYSFVPGKPIYRVAFSQMVQDDRLNAFMGIQSTKELIDAETKRVNGYEDEMQKLTQFWSPYSWWDSVWGVIGWNAQAGVASRYHYLAQKVADSNTKIRAWNDEQRRCKQSLKPASQKQLQ